MIFFKSDRPANNLAKLLLPKKLRNVFQSFSSSSLSSSVSSSSNQASILSSALFDEHFDERLEYLQQVVDRARQEHGVFYRAANAAKQRPARNDSFADFLKLVSSSGSNCQNRQEYSSPKVNYSTTTAFDTRSQSAVPISSSSVELLTFKRGTFKIEEEEEDAESFWSRVGKRSTLHRYQHQYFDSLASSAQGKKKKRKKKKKAKRDEASAILTKKNLVARFEFWLTQLGRRVTSVFSFSSSSSSFNVPPMTTSTI